MPPALRNRPFRLACAAATSAPARSRTTTEPAFPAPANRRLRPVVGSGR